MTKFLLTIAMGVAFVAPARSSNFSVNTTTLVVSGGNVYIGTAAPSASLTGENYEFITAGGPTSNNTPGMGLWSTRTSLTGRIGSFYWLSGATGTVSGSVDLLKDGQDSSGQIIFSPHSNGAINNAMTIRASGNVGVGTTSPATNLDVNGNAQFGSGATKSTFTAAGALSVPYNVNAGSVTVGGASGTTIYGNSSGIGIGTSSPQYALDVAGTSGNLRCNPSQGASGEIPVGVLLFSNFGPLTIANGSAGTSNKTEIAYFNGTQFYSALEVAQVTSGFGNLLLMKSGGNVGINTTTPGAILDVNGATTIRAQETVTSSLTVQGNAFSVGGSTFVVTNGLAGIGTANPGANLEVDGQNFPEIRIRTVVATNGQPDILSFYGNGGQGNGDRNWGIVSEWAAYGDLAIVESGSAGGSVSTGTARAYFAQSGNVGIGTTSPGAILDVAGTVRQSTAKSCSLGVITNSSGDFSACVSSDERLKTKIIPMTSSGIIIDGLNPSYYRWKDAGARDSFPHAGFIAEQVAKVYPQAVVPAGFEQLPSGFTYSTAIRPNGTKYIVKVPVLEGAALYGVDPNAMIALLVKEVQDLRKRVAALESAKAK